MKLLRYLVMSLCVCPMTGGAAAPEPDVSAAAESAALAAAAPADSPAAQTVEAQKAALKARVMAKWEAMIRRDFETAYSFASPGYRALYSLNVFKSQFGNKVAWRRIEVINLDFKDENAAIVGIDLYVGYHSPQSEKTLEMKTYVREPWVRVDGQWWYVMKD